jgi:hypothetical protein
MTKGESICFQRGTYLGKTGIIVVVKDIIVSQIVIGTLVLAHVLALSITPGLLIVLTIVLTILLAIVLAIVLPLHINDTIPWLTSVPQSLP